MGTATNKILISLTCITLLSLSARSVNGKLLKLIPPFKVGKTYHLITNTSTFDYSDDSYII